MYRYTRSVNIYYSKSVVAAMRTKSAEKFLNAGNLLIKKLLMLGRNSIFND